MASIKKIALGLATVLAISTATISPAQASVGTALTVNGNSVLATSVAPAELDVPDNNVVDITNTLKVAVTGLAADTTVTASTNNALVLTSVTDKTSFSGSGRATVNTGSGSDATFYVYTTSISTGSVVVTIGGNSITYYVKGTAGLLNQISLSANDSAGSNTLQRVTVGGIDVFGNIVVGANIRLLTITGNNSDTYNLVTGTAGTDYVDIVLPISGNVTLVATATVASAVTGLAVPVGALTKTIGVRDLVAELTVKDSVIAGLQAQVATLTKTVNDQITDSVTLKNKYNNLVKRYNKKVRKEHRLPILYVK